MQGKMNTERNRKKIKKSKHEVCNFDVCSLDILTSILIERVNIASEILTSDMNIVVCEFLIAGE